MEESTTNPKEYLDIVKRRPWSLILPAATVFCAAVILAFMLPSIYLSEATIFIEAQDVPAEYVASTVTSYVEQRIQAIHQRIMSYTPLLRVINEYGLYPEMRDKYTSEELVEKMRSDTKLKPVSTDIVDRRTGRPGTATIAFVLSYEGRDPQKVQKVNNVLVSLFLEQNIKERVKQVEETSAFLEAEIEKIKTELTAFDGQIAAFKEGHINELPEMIVVNLQSLSNIERHIENVDQQLSSLKEREGYFHSQLASLNPNLENESRVRMEELKLQLVALTKRFSDEYPDVKKTRAELAELKKQLADSNSTAARLPDNPAYITLSAQLASIKAELASVKQQKERLQAEAAEYKRRIAAMPAVESQYNDLISMRKSTQFKYDDLMAKLMEARVAHGLEKEQKGERFTLVEAPRLPEKPYKPNRLAITLIGLVLGLGAGVGTLAFRELTDDAVYSAERLIRATSFPVLAFVPVIATNLDSSQQRLRLLLLIVAAVIALAGGLVFFHFQVMDLNVFWIKLLRRAAI
ncbi:MAG: chain-length determining protein [Desulfobacteraceae bacterium]|nr:MAG: chain-length determining protein [Desulfobacteraceae bacterium]